MQKNLKDKLMEKGWSQDEVNKALKIMYSRENSEGIVWKRTLNPLMYWSALLIAIVGTFMVSIALIPFLIYLSGFYLFFTIILMALIFGFMFELLLSNIEYMEQQHHIIAGAFIPAIAIINVFVIVNIANTLSRIINSSLRQNAIIISIIYVAFFLIPYGLSRLGINIWKKK